MNIIMCEDKQPTTGPNHDYVTDSKPCDQLVQVVGHTKSGFEQNNDYHNIEK